MGTKIGDVLFLEMEVCYIIHDLFQPGEDRKAGIIRVFPIKQIEYGKRIGIAGSKIPVCHCHFVKVHYHGKVSFFVLFFHFSLRSIIRVGIL